MKKDKGEGFRAEYRREDLGKGIRGKYYDEYMAGTNLVLLSPDVAEVFPDEESVNEALRVLIKAARKSTNRTEQSQETESTQNKG